MSATRRCNDRGVRPGTVIQIQSYLRSNRTFRANNSDGAAAEIEVAGRIDAVSAGEYRATTVRGIAAP